MKFATLTLCFYGTSTLERMLRNTGGLVDIIYLSYSPVPWNQYNDSARAQFRSDFDPRTVSTLPFSEKIRFIEGVWDSDEAQREDALQNARRDGIDYLIIQDADEFYLPDEFKRNLDGIRRNPDHPAYTCPWIVFWKSVKYIIEVREHGGKKYQTVTTCPNFAVNVNWPGIHFSKSRLVNEMPHAFELAGLCLHLAWVLSDESVLKKISTWGHSHQFNFKKWYIQKWLAWREDTRHIGHITRFNYTRAVPYKGDLPVELLDLPAPTQIYQPLTPLERVDCIARDLASALRVHLSVIKRALLN